MKQKPIDSNIAKIIIIFVLGIISLAVTLFFSYIVAPHPMSTEKLTTCFLVCWGLLLGLVYIVNKK